MSQIDLATFLRAEAEMAAEVYSDESVPQKLIDAADEIQRLRGALEQIRDWNGQDYGEVGRIVNDALSPRSETK